MSELLGGKAWLGEYEEGVRNRLTQYGPKEEKVVERLWAQDASLWSEDKEDRSNILNRLGWLTSPLTLQARRAEMDCVRDAPYRDVVLLGMGGSSLAPEVFQRIFGNAEGAPRLHVLDNTAADAVQALRDSLDLTQTMFIISSKSGTTEETRSFAEYFYEQTGAAGEHFVVVTDPGSLLIQQSEERGYSALFLNPQDIGGRYSVLSFFGLVPATVIGMDVDKLLSRAEEEIRASIAAVPPAQNDALVLGVIMGEMVAVGRDKLTLIASPTVAPFGDWAEQLVAESTGKRGVGILPVVGERIAPPAAYGLDRFFVYLRLEGEGTHDEQVRALKDAGQPVVQIDLQDVYDLGAQFWRWEFATAVAGAILGINPFNEPNVTESKNNTKRLLQQVQEEGQLPSPEVEVEGNGVRVSGDAAGNSPEEALRAFLDEVMEREYIAILAYVPMTSENEAALRDLQAAIRDASGAATTLGFGPRFLHSTGQFHKGGPPQGRFIQIVTDDKVTVNIPGSPYDFSTLVRAQAIGDLEALERRDYPILRLHIPQNVAETISRLAAVLE